MVCFALGVACSACKYEPEGPCLKGLAVGDRYVIALKRGVPTTPVSACPTGFDLAGGTELTATVSTLYEEVGECSSARAEIAPFDGWSWSPDPARATPEGGANFIGHYLAQKGDCLAGLSARLGAEARCQCRCEVSGFSAVIHRLTDPNLRRLPPHLKSIARGGPLYARRRWTNADRRPTYRAHSLRAQQTPRGEPAPRA
jgi:hypothetical protein